MYSGPHGWRRVPSAPITGRDKRGWLRLRLACKHANEVARGAYGEEGPSKEERKYMPEPEEEGMKKRVFKVVSGGLWA